MFRCCAADPDAAGASHSISMTDCAEDFDRASPAPLLSRRFTLRTVPVIVEPFFRMTCPLDLKSSFNRAVTSSPRLVVAGFNFPLTISAETLLAACACAAPCACVAAEPGEELWLLCAFACEDQSVAARTIPRKTGVERGTIICPPHEYRPVRSEPSDGLTKATGL